jgi:transposase
VFPTARHLASWAGQCPGNDRSAGKQRSGRTRTGSRWPNQALRDAAMAAIRTRNSYLRALYERQTSRIGHGNQHLVAQFQALGHNVTLQEAARHAFSPQWTPKGACRYR